MDPQAQSRLSEATDGMRVVSMGTPASSGGTTKLSCRWPTPASTRAILPAPCLTQFPPPTLLPPNQAPLDTSFAIPQPLEATLGSRDRAPSSEALAPQ